MTSLRRKYSPLTPTAPVKTDYQQDLCPSESKWTQPPLNSFPYSGDGGMWRRGGEVEEGRSRRTAAWDRSQLMGGGGSPGVQTQEPEDRVSSSTSPSQEPSCSPVLTVNPSRSEARGRRLSLSDKVEEMRRVRLVKSPHDQAASPTSTVQEPEDDALKNALLEMANKRNGHSVPPLEKETNPVLLKVPKYVVDEKKNAFPRPTALVNPFPAEGVALNTGVTLQTSIKDWLNGSVKDISIRDKINKPALEQPVRQRIPRVVNGKVQSRKKGLNTIVAQLTGNLHQAQAKVPPVEPSAIPDSGKPILTKSFSSSHRLSGGEVAVNEVAANNVIDRLKRLGTVIEVEPENDSLKMLEKMTKSVTPDAAPTPPPAKLPPKSSSSLKVPNKLPSPQDLSKTQPLPFQLTVPSETPIITLVNVPSVQLLQPPPVQPAKGQPTQPTNLKPKVPLPNQNLQAIKPQPSMLPPKVQNNSLVPPNEQTLQSQPPSHPSNSIPFVISLSPKMQYLLTIPDKSKALTSNQIHIPLQFNPPPMPSPVPPNTTLYISKDVTLIPKPTPEPEMEPEPSLLEPVIDILEEENILNEDNKFMFKMDNFLSNDFSGEQNIFSCDICSAVYVNPNLLKKHYLRLHVSRKFLSEKEMESFGIEPEECPNEKENKKLIFRCHTCKECFPSKTELKSHLTDHPPVYGLGKQSNKIMQEYKCDNCSGVFKWRKQYGKHKKACKPSPLPISVAFENGTLHHCLYCNETFVNANAKRNHILRDHPYLRRKHCCVFCKKDGFPNNVSLFQHLVADHPTEYFACEDCKERFTNLNNLKAHVNTVHNQDQKLIDSVTARLSALNQEKEFYSCDTCQRLFLIESCFNEHQCFPEKKEKDKEKEKKDQTKDKDKKDPIKEKEKEKEKKDQVKEKEKEKKDLTKDKDKEKKDQTKEKKDKEPVKEKKEKDKEKEKKDKPKLQKIKKKVNINEKVEKVPKPFKVMDQETLFYSRISRNVQENLLFYLDGKINKDESVSEKDLLQDTQNRIFLNFSDGFPPTSSLLLDNGSADGPARAKTPWEKYNFPKSYDGRCGLTSYIKDTSYLDISTQLIMRKNLQRLNMLPVREHPTDNDVPSAVALERLGAQCAESYGLLRKDKKGENEEVYDEDELGLSGEWVRERKYVCSVCRWETPCLWEMEDHKYLAHPRVHCPQHELIGEQASLSQTIYNRLSETPSPPFKGAKAMKIPSLDETKCTKCGTGPFEGQLELHCHILDCAGVLVEAIGPQVTRKRRRRSRRRARRGLKRNIPQTPQKMPPKLRTKPGDTETIQRMIANLPAKRVSRKVLSSADEERARLNAQKMALAAKAAKKKSKEEENRSPTDSPVSPLKLFERVQHIILQKPTLLQKEQDLIDTSAEGGDVLSSLRMMPVRPIVRSASPKQEVAELQPSNDDEMPKLEKETSISPAGPPEESSDIPVLSPADSVKEDDAVKNNDQQAQKDDTILSFETVSLPTKKTNDGPNRKRKNSCDDPKKSKKKKENEKGLNEAPEDKKTTKKKNRKSNHVTESDDSSVDQGSPTAYVAKLSLSSSPKIVITKQKVTKSRKSLQASEEKEPAPEKQKKRKSRISKGNETDPIASEPEIPASIKRKSKKNENNDDLVKKDIEVEKEPPQLEENTKSLKKKGKKQKNNKKSESTADIPPLCLEVPDDFVNNEQITNRSEAENSNIAQIVSNDSDVVGAPKSSDGDEIVLRVTEEKKPGKKPGKRSVKNKKSIQEIADISEKLRDVLDDINDFLAEPTFTRRSTRNSSSSLLSYFNQEGKGKKQIDNASESGSSTISSLTNEQSTSIPDNNVIGESDSGKQKPKSNKRGKKSGSKLSAEVPDPNENLAEVSSEIPLIDPLSTLPIGEPRVEDEDARFFKELPFANDLSLPSNNPTEKNKQKKKMPKTRKGKGKGKREKIPSNNKPQIPISEFVTNADALVQNEPQTSITMTMEKDLPEDISSNDEPPMLIESSYSNPIISEETSDIPPDIATASLESSLSTPPDIIPVTMSQDDLKNSNEILKEHKVLTKRGNKRKQKGKQSTDESCSTNISNQSESVEASVALAEDIKSTMATNILSDNSNMENEPPVVPVTFEDSIPKEIGISHKKGRKGKGGKRKATKKSSLEGEMDSSTAVDVEKANVGGEPLADSNKLVVSVENIMEKANPVPKKGRRGKKSDLCEDVTNNYILKDNETVLGVKNLPVGASAPPVSDLEPDSSYPTRRSTRRKKLVSDTISSEAIEAFVGLLDDQELTENSIQKTENQEKNDEISLDTASVLPSESISLDPELPPSKQEGKLSPKDKRKKLHNITNDSMFLGEDEITIENDTETEIVGRMSLRQRPKQQKTTGSRTTRQTNKPRESLSSKYDEILPFEEEAEEKVLRNDRPRRKPRCVLQKKEQPVMESTTFVVKAEVHPEPILKRKVEDDSDIDNYQINKKLKDSAEPSNILGKTDLDQGTPLNKFNMESEMNSSLRTSPTAEVSSSSSLTYDKENEKPKRLHQSPVRVSSRISGTPQITSTSVNDRESDNEIKPVKSLLTKGTTILPKSQEAGSCVSSSAKPVSKFSLSPAHKISPLTRENDSSSSHSSPSRFKTLSIEKLRKQDDNKPHLESSKLEVFDFVDNDFEDKPPIVTSSPTIRDAIKNTSLNAQKTLMEEEDEIMTLEVNIPDDTNPAPENKVTDFHHKKSTDIRNKTDDKVSSEETLDTIPPTEDIEENNTVLPLTNNMETSNVEEDPQPPKKKKILKKGKKDTIPDNLDEDETDSIRLRKGKRIMKKDEIVEVKKVKKDAGDLSEGKKLKRIVKKKKVIKKIIKVVKIQQVQKSKAKEVVSVGGFTWEVSEQETTPATEPSAAKIKTEGMVQEPDSSTSPPEEDTTKDLPPPLLAVEPVVPAEIPGSPPRITPPSPPPVATQPPAAVPIIRPRVWEASAWETAPSPDLASLGSILDSVNKILNEPESSPTPPLGLPSYSLADLQRAMGASDAEMAVLQQLGEASLQLGNSGEGSYSGYSREPEEWGGERCIMDLDNQPPPPSKAPSTQSAVLPESSLSFIDPTADPDYIDNREEGQPEVWREKSMAAPVASLPASVVQAHEGKEFLCPMCNSHFMGFSALYKHILKAHPSIDPQPSRPKRANPTPFPKTDSGRLPVETMRAERLVCYVCLMILPTERMSPHLEHEHQLSPSDVSKCSVLQGDDKNDQPLGEKLKSKMSSKLGTLLDRAVNNLLQSKNKQTNRISGGGIDLLSKLCSIRKNQMNKTRLGKDPRKPLDSDDSFTAKKLFSCSICGLKFSLPASRNKHEVLAHKTFMPVAAVKLEAEEFDDDDWRECPSPPESVGDKGEISVTPTCSDCGLSFDTIQEMLRHRTEDHSARRMSTDTAGPCSSPGSSMLGTVSQPETEGEEEAVPQDISRSSRRGNQGGEGGKWSMPRGGGRGRPRVRRGSSGGRRSTLSVADEKLQKKAEQAIKDLNNASPRIRMSVDERRWVHVLRQKGNAEVGSSNPDD